MLIGVIRTRLIRTDPYVNHVDKKKKKRKKGGENLSGFVYVGDFICLAR